jgi:hypothetical protein
MNAVNFIKIFESKLQLNTLHVTDLHLSFLLISFSFTHFPFFSSPFYFPKNAIPDIPPGGRAFLIHKLLRK